MEKQMKKIRVGIVGLGNIADEKHIPNLLKLDNAVITCVFDLNLERAKAVVEKFGLHDSKIFTSYEDILNYEEVDALHILTPNATHKDMTIKALDGGKHVLVEKPMAMNAKEAEEMIEASKRNGKKLSVSMQNRFRPDSLYAKKMIEDGAVGDIYYGKALALRRRAIPVWGDFLNVEKQGGGAIIDMGVHALDLALWLMQNYKPTKVMANTYQEIIKHNSFNSLGSYEGKDFTVEESGFAFITFENGATLILESSWALNAMDVGEGKCMLCGTKAGLDMKDGLRINGELYGKLYDMYPLLTKDKLEYYNDEKDQERYIEIKSFIDALANDEEPIVKMEELYVVTKIIDAIYESAKTKDVVYLS